MTERGEAKAARVEERQPRFFGKLPAELVTKIFNLATTPHYDWIEEVGDLKTAIARIAKVRALNKSCACWLLLPLCRLVLRLMNKRRSMLRCDVFTDDAFDIGNKYQMAKDRMVKGLFEIMTNDTDGTSAFRGLRYLSGCYEKENGHNLRMKKDLDETGRIRPLSP